MPRTGRPPLPAEDRRSHRVDVTLSEASLDEIRTAAAEMGVAPSALAARRVVARSRCNTQPKLHETAVEELRAHTSALNRLLAEQHRHAQHPGLPSLCRDATQVHQLVLALGEALDAFERGLQ